MIDLVMMPIIWIFKTLAWVSIALVQLIGGILFGEMRTRADRRGYQPKRLGDSLELDLELETYVITLSSSSQWDAEQSLRFVNHLISLGRCLLQIVAEQSDISFRVVFIDGIEEALVREAITSFYPESKVEVVPYAYQITHFPLYRYLVPLMQVNIFPAPILQVNQIKYFDPLIPLTQALSELGEGERVVYTVAVLDDAVGASEAGFRLITASTIHPLDYTYLKGAYIAEMKKAQGLDRVPKFEGNIQNVLKDKLNSPLFHCMAFVQVESPSEERVKLLASSVIPHVMQFANMPFNTLIVAQEKQTPLTEFYEITEPGLEEWSRDVLLALEIWLNPEVYKKEASWKYALLVLQAEEIAALWHLPYEGFTAPAIEWMTAKQVALPKGLRGQENGRFLGFNQYGGKTIPVYLPLEDRTSHMTVIGKSGTGKSNFLHHLIAQDIADGKGVCVVDPHGTLISHILQASIPKEREDDVVILDVANEIDGQFYPPPLNLLARPDRTIEAGVAVGMLAAILMKLYEGFEESRMAHLLTNALITLSVQPSPTLLDIERLFTELDYRIQLVEQIDNVAVRRFWTRFDSETPAQQQQMTSPLLRRLDTFYTNNALLAITCHPAPIDLKKLIGQNKIILVSLAADETKIQALERMVLGATFVAQMQLAAMAGAVSQPPYMLYLDEAQQLISTALPTMLSEARKHGLGLVLANQYYKQLAGETFEAVEGNIGTIVAFEVGESDARMLINYLKPSFTVNDLLNLGKYRAAVSLRDAQGTRQPAFSLETQAVSLPKTGKKREAALRRKSVENYTPKPYSEIKAWLQARYLGEKPPVLPTRQDGQADEFIEPKTPSA